VVATALGYLIFFISCGLGALFPKFVAIALANFRANKAAVVMEAGGYLVDGSRDLPKRQMRREPIRRRPFRLGKALSEKRLGPNFRVLVTAKSCPRTGRNVASIE
jgi:hypothetical protein